jgi:hypothetical protein
VDLNTVTMDQEEAAKAFREYRGAFMAHRNQIDGELMRSYKALSEGKTLISLVDALRRGGVDEIGRPRLAIARADEPWIEMSIDRDGSVTYDPNHNTRVRHPDRLFMFGAETMPRPPLEQDQQTWNAPWSGWWMANLPFIPPQYRPPHGLVNYHLLWEAEWRRSRGSQRRDPMLLKRLGGDLFAVLAAWDLTEIEKLVLAR